MSEEKVSKYPVLAPGETPPGRWEPSGIGGGSVWKGDCVWITEHGPARIKWLLGRPSKGMDVLTPEGRMDVEATLPDRSVWRRASPAKPGHFIRGTVAIEDFDVTFTDAESQVQESGARTVREDDAEPSLEADIAGDAAFRERLQDMGFATAAYESLCNAEYRKGTSPRRWSCSWRTSGAIMADLRGRNEDYIDFYCGRVTLENGELATPEERGRLLGEVLGHYERLGWHLVERAEAMEDDLRALAEIEEIEKRPEGPCPSWARSFADREPTTTVDRLYVAAKSGRMTREEYARLAENVDYGFDRA